MINSAGSTCAVDLLYRYKFILIQSMIQKKICIYNFLYINQISEENSWLIHLENIMEPIKIEIKPRRVTIILGIITIILAFLSMLVWYVPRHIPIKLGRWVDFFALDSETNLPTMFSVILFLTCTILILTIAQIIRRDKEAGLIHWIVLAVGFFYMACDDFMMLHERLLQVVDQIIGTNRSELFLYGWVIPAMILLVMITIFYVPFLIKLPKRTRWIFITACIIFLGGSLGLEMIEGVLVVNFGPLSKWYVFVSNIEESMELLGTVCFIYGLLDYIQRKNSNILFQFTKTSTSNN
jgi:hypothetical protein